MEFERRESTTQTMSMFLNSTADLPYSQPVHVNNSFTHEIRGPLKSLGLLTVLPEPIS